MKKEAKQILYEIQSIYSKSVNIASSKSIANIANHVKYPLIKVSIESYNISVYNDKFSYGILNRPGIYDSTLTRIDVFEKYYLEQLELLIENQKCDIDINISSSNIPITFIDEKLIHDFPIHSIRKLLPDLHRISHFETINNKLTFFHAERVDYSICRLEHYTKTNIKDFQEYIILVNYRMYTHAFKEIFKNECIKSSSEDAQMYTIHSKKYGISIINIGVGPSNAKNITDHLAVLRSKLWVMLGHCAGLNQFQSVGEYIIADKYVRDDKLMHALVPEWVPIGSIKPITDIISRVCDQKIHFGTVISTADRNWELDTQRMMNIIDRSNASGLDMESGTVACNAHLYKIPHVTFLCISDIPTYGMLKLQYMANNFYQQKTFEHSEIILKSIEKIKQLDTHEVLKHVRTRNDPPWR